MPWKFPAMFPHEKIHILLVSFLFVAVALFFVTNRDIIRCLNCANSVKGSGDEKPERSDEPRVAVCLVGKARWLELTAASVVDRVINVFPNSDLFFHSPLDQHSYKLSLLNGSRRIASVRIVEQKPMPETEEEKQVLSVDGGDPMGVQGLLHYFKLVEGCLNMIDDYQGKTGIRYDWIVRIRADSYWSSPLRPIVFIPGSYTIPFEVQFAGLNDRFGAGDRATSCAALARFSVIPWLYKAGYRWQNSESAFKHQIQIQKVPIKFFLFPFCIISKRTFKYPASWHDTIVASINSTGWLDGAYCRPCKPVCSGQCATHALEKLDPQWSWVLGEPQLCDSGRGWPEDADSYFDSVIGERFATARKQIVSMDTDRCVAGLDSMKKRVGAWDAPSPMEICSMRLR